MLISIYWISIPFTMRDPTRRHWGDWAYYNYVDLSIQFWRGQKSVFETAQTEFVHPMAGIVVKATSAVTKVGKDVIVEGRRRLPSFVSKSKVHANVSRADEAGTATSIAYPPSSAEGVIFADKTFYHVESDPVVKLLLIRTGNVEEAQVVHATLHNDTARALVDFDPLETKEVVFNAGERTAYIRVKLVDNKIWEPNKYFHVSIDEGGVDYSGKAFYMRRHDWCLSTVVIINEDQFPGKRSGPMQNTLWCRLTRLRLYVILIIRDLESKLPHYFKKGFLVWLTLGYIYSALHSKVITVQVCSIVPLSWRL